MQKDQKTAENIKKENIDIALKSGFTAKCSGTNCSRCSNDGICKEQKKWNKLIGITTESIMLRKNKAKSGNYEQYKVMQGIK